MECTQQVFPDLKLGVVSLQGDITSAGVLDLLTRLAADEHWHPSYSTLWDARGIQRITIIPSDLDLLMQCSTLRQERHPGRVAVVVSRQIEHQILSLLLVHRDANPRITKVFCDVSSALGWLGLEATDVLLDEASVVA